MIEALHTAPFAPDHVPSARGGGMNARTKDAACPSAGSTRILRSNKTRQGYARERILKPAGYFFVRPKSAAHCALGGAR